MNKTLCVLLVFWVTGCVSVERDYYETSAVVEKIKNKDNNIRYIEGSILDYKTVNNACKNIDTIFHLAYINGTKFFYEKPKKIYW